MAGLGGLRNTEQSVKPRLFVTDVLNSLLIPCTKRLTMMVSKPSVLVAVQV